MARLDQDSVRVALVSGSRADQAALIAVKEALKRAEVPHKWLNIHTPQMTRGDRLDVAQAAGMACKWIAGELAGKQIDLVLVHGDRYEVLGAATATFLLGLPIGHLGGGDITAGSQDDSIRNAITKLSHLHFASCKESAKRLINQLGEDPKTVFVTGDPGTDNLVTFDERPILDSPNFLVAYHPNTLGDTKEELALLERAIRVARRQWSDLYFFLINPNKDAGHLLIERRFKVLAERNPRTQYLVDLPRFTYLCYLKHATALIGNSSAAYYEAPYFGTPVVNFGDRQKGRLKSPNHISTVTTVEGLLTAMEVAYNAKSKRQITQPYGAGHSADKIVRVIKTLNPKVLLKKMEPLNGRASSPSQ